MESDFHSFFGRRFFSFFFDLGSILGGFGRPKRRQKSSFGRFFFDVFFECVSASILDRFFEVDFFNFFLFWVDFGRLLDAKMETKIHFFVFFRCFFRVRFCIDFGSFLGGSKPEK